MNPEMYIRIGIILGARENVLRVKKKYKDQFAGAQRQFNQAKADYNDFGMFDDCGPSYESSYDEAKGRLEASKEAVENVISTEKYYKKLKHEFKEDFPDEEVTLQYYIDRQTDEMQKSYHDVSKAEKKQKKVKP